MNNNQENGQLQIEVKPEVANGTYSNLAIISHAKTEFVIDFASMLPGMQKAQVVSRILMNPEHAKRLLAALSENISKYESNFGPIGAGQKGTFNISDFNPNGAKS